MKAAVFFMLVMGCLGCERSWHDRFAWKAEDYFKDPETIQLCMSIQNNDLRAIEAAIESGADVNVVGTEGMTPLLWAFPDNKIERFQLLINAGADASILTKSDFKTNGRIKKGTTVAHLAAASLFPNQFLAIVRKGIDANLEAACFPKEGNLFYAIMYARPWNNNTIERVEALLLLKPDQSTLNQAVKVALACNEFEITLLLLESGAEFNSPFGLWGSPVHRVVAGEQAKGSFSHSELKAHNRLVEWLEAKGADLESARNDFKRWSSQMGFDFEKSAAIRMNELRERAVKENGETDFELPGVLDVMRRNISVPNEGPVR